MRLFPRETNVNVFHRIFISLCFIFLFIYLLYFFSGSIKTISLQLNDPWETNFCGEEFILLVEVDVIYVPAIFLKKQKMKEREIERNNKNVWLALKLLNFEATLNQICNLELERKL